MAETKPTAPRVPALPDGRGGLRMWCAWCDRWHYHGPGYGHRSAHCHKSSSPYRASGYILADSVRMELSDRRAARLEDLIVAVLDAEGADRANVLYWAVRQAAEMAAVGLLTRLEVADCFAAASAKVGIGHAEADRVVFSALSHAGVIP